MASSTTVQVGKKDAHDWTSNKTTVAVVKSFHVTDSCVLVLQAWVVR